MRKNNGFTLLEVICYISLMLVFVSGLFNFMNFSLTKASITYNDSIKYQQSQNLELYIKNQLAQGQRILSLQEGDTIVKYVIFQKPPNFNGLYKLSKKEIKLSKNSKLLLETKNCILKADAEKFITLSEEPVAINVIFEDVTEASSQKIDNEAVFNFKINYDGKDSELQFSLPFEKNEYEFLN